MLHLPQDKDENNLGNFWLIFCNSPKIIIVAFIIVIILASVIGGIVSLLFQMFK